jgi:hypothetical protein
VQSFGRFFLVGDGFEQLEELLIEMWFDMQHGVFVGAVLYYMVCVEQDVDGQILK